MMTKVSTHTIAHGRLRLHGKLFVNIFLHCQHLQLFTEALCKFKA